MILLGVSCAPRLNIARDEDYDINTSQLSDRIDIDGTVDYEEFKRICDNIIVRIGALYKLDTSYHRWFSAKRTTCYIIIWRLDNEL